MCRGRTFHMRHARHQLRRVREALAAGDEAKAIGFYLSAQWWRNNAKTFCNPSRPTSRTGRGERT